MKSSFFLLLMLPFFVSLNTVYAQSIPSQETLECYRPQTTDVPLPHPDSLIPQATMEGGHLGPWGGGALYRKVPGIDYWERTSTGETKPVKPGTDWWINCKMFTDYEGIQDYCLDTHTLPESTVPPCSGKYSHRPQEGRCSANDTRATKWSVQSVIESDPASHGWPVFRVTGRDYAIMQHQGQPDVNWLSTCSPTSDLSIDHIGVDDRCVSYRPFHKPPCPEYYSLRTVTHQTEGVRTSNPSTRPQPVENLLAEFNWTEWLNRDTPGGSGDYDTLKDFVSAGKACAQPTDVQCRRVSDGADWSTTGQVYTCNTQVGGVCKNDGQECDDYEVRFSCSTAE